MVKALDLVRKVSSLRASLKDREEMGRRAAVTALKVTTALARQMQRMPVPRPSAAERGALSLAAAPLRQLIVEVPPGEQGSPEEALVELVKETLALVDKLLEGDPELPRERPAPELPVPSTDKDRHKVRF